MKIYVFSYEIDNCLGVFIQCSVTNNIYIG